MWPIIFSRSAKTRPCSLFRNSMTTEECASVDDCICQFVPTYFLINFYQVFSEIFQYISSLLIPCSSQSSIKELFHPGHGACGCSPAEPSSSEMDIPSKRCHHFSFESFTPSHQETCLPNEPDYPTTNIVQLSQCPRVEQIPQFIIYCLPEHTYKQYVHRFNHFIAQ